MKKILGVPIVNVNDFEFDFEVKTITKKKSDQTYCADFGTFDIETSAIPAIKQSFMYIWQYYINGQCVIGRTWNEYIDFMRKLSEYVYPATWVTYVHNLSYEFVFISGIYKFTNDEVFAVDSRKVLKCNLLGNLEYRCSYLLSNMTLDLYTNKMKVEHIKLTGTYNYDKLRTCTYIMSDDELAYCVNDVVGLHEAITVEMSLFKDNIITIPLTSTGYVRRDCRKVMYKYKRTLIDKIYPTYPIYKLLRQEFRGGNTHANRYYAGRILDDVKSMDMSSSYPNVLNNCRYPMTKFKTIDCETEKELRDLIKKDYAVLATVVFENIRLKDEFWGCPYLSFDKSRCVYGDLIDNGRILQAEILETTINDIDFKIIDDEYTWDKCIVTVCAISTYGKLPQELIDVCIEYFKKKTELKDVEGEEVYYTKMKNLLNAIYGMMAQNPVKQDILYDCGDWNLDDENEMDLLNESQKTAFLVYQWACWITAWARWMLEQGIKAAGHNFVYADTDSVKYVNDLDISDFNTQRQIESEASGSYAYDKKGKIHYMGVFEQERTYKRFITFGAKKYAYEYYNDVKAVRGKKTSKYKFVKRRKMKIKLNKMYVTISGVNKSKGAKEISKKGGLDNLKMGYVFSEAGGMNVVYNDNNFGQYKLENGETVYITRNAYMEPSTYQLGLSKDYYKLLTTIAATAAKHLVANY